MRHPEHLDLTAERAELVELHLEECQRCRDRLETPAGVDLDRAASALGPALDPRPARRARLTTIPGPALAAVVFIAVLVSGGLSLWFASTDSTPADVVDTTTTTVPETTQAPVAAFSDRQAFELAWELDSGDVGHFLWIADARWVTTRLEVDNGRPVERYRVGKDVSSNFWSSEDDLLDTEDDRTWQVEGTGPGVPGPPDIAVDTAIPYPLLVAETSLDGWQKDLGQAWAAELVPAEPTHPHAALAWATGQLRVEFTSDGIPVLLASPEDTYRVVSLDRRKIDRIELQTNMSVPIAAWLSTVTTSDQQPVLADARVGHSEWLSALQTAVDCSNLDIEQIEVDEFETQRLTRDCYGRYLSDIETVRNIQLNNLPFDEVEILWYEMEGNLEMAELLTAEEEDRVRLSGPHGTVFMVARRGDGWCYATTSGNSGSEACIHPAVWQAPGVFEFSPGWGSDGWGEVQGLTVPTVVTMRLWYADGSFAS